MIGRVWVPTMRSAAARLIMNKLPSYLVTWLPGYLVSWLPGYLVTWLPGYLVTWLPGYLLSRHWQLWLEGSECRQWGPLLLDWLWTSYLVTWLPGYLVTWLPGYLVTWLPGYLVTWLPGYLLSRHWQLWLEGSECRQWGPLLLDWLWTSYLVT